MSRSNEPRPKPLRQQARFAYTGLDRLIHEPARLRILTSLAAHADGLVFNDLKSLCSLTDGNLSRQLQTLSDAGVVEIWKSQRDRRPQTLVRLTRQGRKRFALYLDVLESVLADASAVESDEPLARPARGIQAT